MNKLYEIMGDLSEIMFSMESFSCILESLEEHYQYKQEYEIQKNIIIFKILIDSISKTLSARIDKIDRFILDNRK